MGIFFGFAEWNVENEKAEVQHFMKHSSDHTMFLLDTHPDQPPRKTRFIYENRWIKKLGCPDVVQSSWNINVTGSRMFQFHRKLKNVRTGLLEWRKKEGTNSGKHIESLTTKMDRMCEKMGQRDWEA